LVSWRNIAQCSEKELSLRRRARVGFVFQNFNLIDDLNVAENVEVALLYLGVASAERRQRVAAALERVDLAHRARHMRGSSRAVSSSESQSRAPWSRIPS